MFKQYDKVYHESYPDKRRIIAKRICKKGFVWVSLGRGTCWVLEKDCRREK